MNRSLFNSAEHYALVVGVVRENPIRPGEHVLAYLERIAIESALMKPWATDPVAWPAGQTASEREAKLGMLREQAKVTTG